MIKNSKNGQMKNIERFVCKLYPKQKQCNEWSGRLTPTFPCLVFFTKLFSYYFYLD